MNNVIYDYPKSLCNYCNKDLIINRRGIPTNMSVENCNFCDVDCFNGYIFKEQIEPRKGQIRENYKENSKEEERYVYYNSKEVDKYKLDPTFYPINAKYCPSACPKITYVSNDPRLYSETHLQMLQLDRPPYVTTVKLDTLTTDKKLDNYGQNYKSYKDVNARYIKYYIDKEREDVYYDPLFSIKSNVKGVLYKDPMGTIKPHYIKKPVETYNPITGKDIGNYELTWMRDSQYHRESILASQMAVINQERWEPRWTNIL